MTLELVMNGSGILGHGAGSTITGGVFTISSVPDLKSKAVGVGIYVDPLVYKFSGGSAPGFVDGSVVGGGTIPATATKTKVSGSLVMRVGDSATMNATGTIPPPTGGTGPVVGPVEVTNAGQTKVKAQ